MFFTWSRISNRFPIAICWLVCLVAATQTSCGDEVVIDDQARTFLNVGDFKCSGCPEQVTRSMDLFGKNSNGQVSAGALWQFFHNQGVDSIDRLTLCVDIDQLDSNTSFDVQGIQLQIEDPMLQGQYLTNVSLGNNSLKVLGNSTSSFKPEAKLEILLNYDFMKRFSADSTEMIKLDFASSGELGSRASVSIEGNGNVFSRFNLIMLIGFVGFWIVVFVVLNLVTKPITGQESLAAKPMGVGLHPATARRQTHS